MCWGQFLKRHGHVVQSFNQLSKAEQKQVQGFLAAEFGMPEDGTKATADQHEPKTGSVLLCKYDLNHPPSRPAICKTTAVSCSVFLFFVLRCPGLSPGRWSQSSIGLSHGPRSTLVLSLIHI